MFASPLKSAVTTFLPRHRAAGHDLTLGFLVGVCVISWTAQFTSTFGVSVTTETAIVVVAAAAALLGRSRRVANLPTAGALFLLAAWTVAFPWIMSLGRSVAGLVALESLASPVIAGSLVLAEAALALAVPLAVAVRLLSSVGDAAIAGHSPIRLLAVVAALTIVPLTLAPAIGAHACGLVAACVGIVLFVLEFRHTPSIGDETKPPRAQGVPHSERFQTLVIAVGIGAACAALSRLIDQLLLGAAFVTYAEWAGVLAGVALALSRRNSTRVPSPGWSALACGLAVAIPVVMFPALVHASLFLSARIASLPLVLSLRILLAAGLVLPLGFACGLLFRNRRSERRHDAALLGAAALGWLAVRWAALAPDVAAGAIGISMLLVAIPFAWSPGGAGRRVAAVRTIWGTAAAAMLVVLVLDSRYDPARAARLLFSTQSFGAFNAGMDDALIVALDESREIATVNGRAATWTLWKQRGKQFSIRRNGVPHALLTADPSLCPQASAELCPAVIPLALHPQPRRVLWFGLGGATGVAASLTFPVESVSCIEPDADLVRLIDEQVRPRFATDPLSDARFQRIAVDPILAAASRTTDRYDVIVLNESIPALARNAPAFTREFYQALSGKLADNGLLCQRFQFMDVGPRPIAQMTRTMSSVFPQVHILETAPGELLLIASPSPSPLMDESALTRFQQGHVRRLLSQLGWDWSIVFRLRAVTSAQAQELAASEDARPNTSANSRFAFSLPPEVMRWGAKWQDVQRLLSRHSTVWAKELEETKGFEELSQRLADVQKQQQIFQEYPDQFWAYRKTLKQRLTDRPRTAIQQVAHEGLKRGLHPEDQRRKDYLVALGRAAKQEHPRPEDVAFVQRFVEPYDPLVSDFVHPEVASLLERAEPQLPALELSHRLHAVYYAPPADRSVRQIVAALESLLNEPAAMPDPVDRWDEVNSLAELLRQRWLLRTTVGEQSKYEPVDTEKSIEVARDVVDRLETLASDAGIDPQLCDARRQVLEQSLLRPLRSYRSNQLKKRPIPSPTAAAPPPPAPPVTSAIPGLPTGAL